MRYFPLTTDRFEHQFGVRALGESESVVEATDLYRDELQLKRELIGQDRDYYFQSRPDSLAAQRDVFDLLETSAPFLRDGHNQLIGKSIQCDDTCPLLSISRHVQEDLTIMSGSDPGNPLIAGCVTFPSGWCIGNKLGQSILDIHKPVPEFDSVLNPQTEKLMDRLKVGRPVWRMNWGVRASAQLDQSPKHAEKLNAQRDQVTAENAGQRCFFRVERQTLARLPNSGDILFAIHTHQLPLGKLNDQQRSNLLGVLRTCPTDTLRYKGILPMRDALVGYLVDHANGPV